VSDAELCFLPASEALAKFSAGRLSPVDLMTASIARIERINPRLNALINADLNKALADARAAEARYRKGRARPLEGLPVAIKDGHDLAGWVTTFGSRLYAAHRPERSLPTVERLISAGAIPVARSTTPEFMMATVTWSPLWGVTRNPWNPAMSPGGSSGGAAAAAAAGLVALADGSDYAGSIRTPASCCGVVGYKPPYGRNPGPLGGNLDPFLHYGPIARTVADAALMQEVMAGPHAQDQASLRQRVHLPRASEPIAGWSIAYSLDLGLFDVEEDVKRNCLDALAVFRELGAQTIEVELGWTRAALDAYETYCQAQMAAQFGPLLGRADALAPYVVAYVSRGMSIRTAAFIATQRVIADMYATFGPILEKHRLFICPTTAVPALPADFDPACLPAMVAGRRLSIEDEWQLTWPFNMLSRCPVLAVPSGVSDGVPTGIQIVGRSYEDASVFRAGLAYEKARPWRHPPCD
jgi:amidase